MNCLLFYLDGISLYNTRYIIDVCSISLPIWYHHAVCAFSKIISLHGVHAAHDHLSLRHHYIIHKYKLSFVLYIIYNIRYMYESYRDSFLFFCMEETRFSRQSCLETNSGERTTTICPAVSLVLAKDFSSHRQSVRRESSHTYTHTRAHTHWILSSSRINHVLAACCHFRRSAGP